MLLAEKLKFSSSSCCAMELMSLPAISDRFSVALTCAPMELMSLPASMITLLPLTVEVMKVAFCCSP